VYPADLSATVTLAAPDALSLAGLRRVACLAGLRENHDEASTTMSLRHQGYGEPHKSLDVEIGEQGVVVRFDRPPAPDTWRRLYTVLGILGFGSEVDDLGRQRTGARVTSRPSGSTSDSTSRAVGR
jgi:hypothetical protein